jgi:hypothetical protein
MSEAFNPVATFIDAANEAVKTITEDVVKEQLARVGLSSLLVAASGPVAAIGVGHIMTPVIQAFLVQIDPIEQRLDTILKEPLQTGVQLARQAVNLHSSADIDKRLKESLFVSALESFERAHSYAEINKKYDESRRIRFNQALLAKAMGSASSALYWTAARAVLDQEYSETRQRLANLNDVRSLASKEIAYGGKGADVVDARKRIEEADPKTVKAYDYKWAEQYLRKHLKERAIYFFERSRKPVVETALAEFLSDVARARLTKIEAFLRFMTIEPDR